MNGRFDEAAKRYSDFIDIHQVRFPDAARLAEEFLLLANEQFRKPPRWRNAFALSMMNDLGL